VRFRSTENIARRCLLGRLFSSFPGGWPGVALLLLRAAIGLALLNQGGGFFHEPNRSMGTWFVCMGALASAALLLVGLLTPIVAALVGLGGIGIELSILPTCTSPLFDSGLPMMFSIAILLAIIVLGPGAFSVDARLFGRREIIISAPFSRSQR
jgi:uncharacterized membrane protein YphA (DoxX/SURF4 family)